MSDQSVEAIRRYTTAYHNIHGNFPEIRSNNGWIKIRNMHKSLRPFEVMEMAQRLERRAMEERPLDRNRIRDTFRQAIEERERQEREREQDEQERRMLLLRLRAESREVENSVWDVRDELNARVQAQIQNEVKQVILDDNNESKVKIMGWREHIRKDSMVMFFNKLFEKASHSAFAMQRMMEHFIHFGNFGDENERDCDECEVQGELESMYERMHELEHDIDSYRDDLSNRNSKIGMLERTIKNIKKEKEELKKNSVIFSMDEF